MTKLSWFTNSTWAPEFLNGQVKSIVQKAYWVTEENGEFIQGDLVTMKDLDSLGWVYNLALEFDPDGMVTLAQRLDDNGNVFSYDDIQIEEGKYMKVKDIRQDTARRIFVFSHDDVGNFSHMEQIRLPEDTLINTYDFKFDEKGNWMGGNWGNYLGEPGWSHKFVYDENNLVTLHENFNEEGEKASWHTYTYDENGFSLSWIATRADTTYHDLTFKYPKVDDRDNWLEMVSLENGKVSAMDVRTIEYY